MNKLRTIILVALCILPSAAHAQSLKVKEPAPLQEGLNRGETDCFIGPHYWYFTATPGQSEIKIRFAAGKYLMGSALRCPLGIEIFAAGTRGPGGDMYQGKRLNGITVEGTAAAPIHPKNEKTWVLWSTGETTEITIPMKGRSGKLCLALVPPSQDGRGERIKVRTGGVYEVVVTGAAQFSPPATGEPLVKSLFLEGNSHFGKAVLFQADGSIQTPDGSKGSWKLFDPDAHIYQVLLGDNAAVRTLKYIPGRGLCSLDADAGVVFLETALDHSFPH